MTHVADLSHAFLTGAMLIDTAEATRSHHSLTHAVKPISQNTYQSNAPSASATADLLEHVQAF